jgi:hypothetical protein
LASPIELHDPATVVDPLAEHPAAAAQVIVSSSAAPPAAASDTSRAHGTPSPTHSSREDVDCDALARFVNDPLDQRWLVPAKSIEASAWFGSARAARLQRQVVRFTDAVTSIASCGARGMSCTVRVEDHSPGPHPHVSSAPGVIGP